MPRAGLEEVRIRVIRTTRLCTGMAIANLPVTPQSRAESHHLRRLGEYSPLKASA